MARYIDADMLIEFANNSRIGIDANDIARFPASDVEEVKHGHWVDDIREIPPLNGYIKRKTLVGYKCSECGRAEIFKEPYCNCGAKMDL